MGAAGQRISVRLVSAVPPSGLVTNVAIIKPDGSNLATYSPFNFISYFIEPIALPVNGTYKVLVDPQVNKLRTNTLHLYDVPPDATIPLTINPSPDVLTAVNLPVPGQAANLNFQVGGTTSQQVTIRLRENAIGPPGNTFTLTLSLQGGSQIQEYITGPPSDGNFQHTLAPGTYVIRIDPFTDYTGSVKIKLTSP